MPPPPPTASVVVVTCDRTRELRACIDSLRAQPEEAFEVILVLNGANDAVRRLSAETAEADPRFRSIECTRRPASAARNLAAAEAGAPLLYFLDDDIELTSDGIETLLQVAAQYPEAAVIGGPNLTPPDDPPFAQMAGALLASTWGSGPTSPRYERRKATVASDRDLILCNLAVRRKVFELGHRFPERYFGGEENVLMGFISEAGGGMRYIPELWVYHRRRATWWGHLEQMYRYGRGRAVATLWVPKTFHPAFFAPVGLMFYLLAAPLLAWLGVIAWWLPAAAYGLGSAIAAAAIAGRHRTPSWWPQLLVLFPLSHVAYGLGLLLTLVSRPGAVAHGAVPGKSIPEATPDSEPLE